ncbi:MAG: hypothetical protein ABH871_08985 [Pseudomonadota bacterium]
MDTKRLERRLAIEWIILLAVILSCFLAGNLYWGYERLKYEQNISSLTGKLSKGSKSALELYESLEKIDEKERPHYGSAVVPITVLGSITTWMLIAFIRVTIWSIRVVVKRDNN